MRGGALPMVAAAVGVLAAVPQTPALRYGARQLDCTRWAEASRSRIETVTERASATASSGRDGRLILRARDTTGGVAVEAWYDSLAVWRRSGGDEVAPDTDGIIGGRYRGLLETHGGYVSRARPFVPDEIAEVAELAGILDDLLPPLPPRLLAPGTAWRGEGVTIRRLPDTLAAGRTLLRFALEGRSQRSETVPHGDTVPVPVDQSITEAGQFLWDPGVGLVRRTREIVVETSIAAGGRVRLPVRSRVVQEVSLARLPGRCS